MEDAYGASPPVEGDSRGPGDSGSAEDSAPVWPPRVLDPPRLPFMPEQEEPLALEDVETAVAPPEPDFTRSRLDEARAKVERRTGESSPVLAYDRKNPSGRTRGDTVLRPTDEDRVNRVKRKRHEAALAGALLVGFLTLLLSPWSLFHLAGMVGAGGLAGVLAWELGDSEPAWALAIGLAGVPLAWNYGSLAVILCVSLMTGAGWLAGFTRDANLT